MFHFQLVLFSEIYNFSVEFCKGLVTSSCFSKGHPLLGRGSSFKNKKIKPTLERYSARLHPMRTVVIHFGTPGIGKVLQVLRRSSSAALQSRLPSLLQKGRIVGRGQSSGASAQSIPQRLSDSFPAAAGWSDVVGESASDRHPLQMPLRTLVRSVLLLLWTGHGWSQFLPARVEECGVFRSFSSSIESDFFTYHRQ